MPAPNTAMTRTTNSSPGKAYITSVTRDTSVSAQPPRQAATVPAPHTPTGNTNEALTGLVVADALVLALTTLDETRAVEHSHQLTALREQLLAQKEPRGRRA